MSKQQAIRAIRAEIERLNQQIDLNIIKGVSYRREALRHKFLRSQLVRLQPQKGWFGRSLSFMSAYMF
jgi:hypothetical protein